MFLFYIICFFASLNAVYPIAIPIHAVAQIPAAVVNPVIPLEFFKIAPAPIKPIPDNTCAGNLAGSMLLYELYDINNCTAVIDVIQEPTATSIWVLNPAN